jgi:UDP-glucose 4-epimerase
MAKILVTGGAGFIGSHLVDSLIERGNNVVVIDNLSSGKKENLNSKAIFHRADICDSSIAGILKNENPDVIFHLAAKTNARKSVEDPITDAKTNIIGSLNIIESFLSANGRDCQKLAAKKIIFFSTGGVMYGEANVIPTPEAYSSQPICPYGVNKLAVEKYLNYYNKIFGLPYIVLRLANVYGPRQDANGKAGVVAVFCGEILSGKVPVINGDGEQTRDYIYIEDVVSAAQLVMEKGNNDFFNIGTGKETSVNEIFRGLKKFLDSTCEENHGPAKSGEHKRGCLDSSKAKQKIDWQPEYSVEDGLKKTAAWFRESKKYE